MTARELIELLEQCDPDAKVYIMMQENYPFECALSGINIRDSFESCDGDDSFTLANYTSDTKQPNDVFLIEGRQLSYGSRDAWANVIRS